MTKVSKEGTIKIPHTPSLVDRDVEIIILPKKRETLAKGKAAALVEKWAGSVSDKDAHKAKYDYLNEKHS